MRNAVFKALCIRLAEDPEHKFGRGDGSACANGNHQETRQNDRNEIRYADDQGKHCTDE